MTHTHTHTRRRSLRLGLGLLILAGAGSMVPTLSAQPGGGGPSGWIGQVPLAECDCSAPDPWGPCEGVAVKCMRTDSPPVLTSSGYPLVLTGDGTCLNCGGPCDSGTSLTCNNTAGVSFTDTVQVTLSANISGGIPPINASFSAAYGWTAGTTSTYSFSCAVTVQPCKMVEVHSTLNGTVDREYEITHTWSLVGTWDCLGGCCEHGQTWTEPCGTDKSTATGSIHGQGSCTTDPTYDCIF